MIIAPDLLAADADTAFDNCKLAKGLADRMRASSEDLTHRWLDRISARVRLDPNRIFPTDALLDHVPMLILGIADYIENSYNPQRRHSHLDYVSPIEFELRAQSAAFAA